MSTVSSVIQQPALPPVSDDQKIQDYVQSFLSQFLSQSGIVGTNPSVSAPLVVPHSSPPSWGATGGGGAASLNRGRPTEASGMVPPVMQKDQIPPSRVLLHDLALDSHNLGRFSGSPFPGLGLGNLDVSTSMDQLCGRDESRGIYSGSFPSATSVGVSSVVSPASLLFPVSDSGFSSFPLPSSSSIGCSSSSSSSALGFSSVAPSLPPSSLPVFSLPSVVPSVLAVSDSTPPSSLPLVLPPGFPPSLPFPSGCPSPFPRPSSSAFPLSSTPCSVPFALSSFSASTVSSFPPIFPSSSSSGSSSSSSEDFASAQARVLGLSAEYQAVGRWFV